MTVCFIRLSDAQPASWTVTDAFTGTGATVTGTLPEAIATTSVTELIAVGGTLVTAVATATSSGAITYAFATDGNPNSVATATITSGVVTLATGMYLDYETTPTIIFKIVATEASATAGTATVTLSVLDAVEFSPNGFCLSGTSFAAGTSIGSLSSDQSTIVVTTTLGGTDSASFTMTAAGAVTVATGVTLVSAQQGSYVFTTSATATGKQDSGTVSFYVLLNCSSGAGQVAALISVLVLSLASALFY